MVANPALLIVSVYRPGARLRKAKWPSVLVVSVCVKLVAKFFASTVAPATLPPFSSRTSPWTVPAVICDWLHADEAMPSASVKTKNANNSFLIFSPPDITTPIRTSPGIPRKVRRLARTIAAREFMPRWSESTRAALVETFGTSNQVLDALNRFAETHHACRTMTGTNSAIIAARGNNSRCDSCNRNDGGAGRAVLRHAAWRFRRRCDQGGAARRWRPVTRLGPAVCGQRIRILSRGQSQQALDYSQLQSSARRGSVAEIARERRCFYYQPTVSDIASKARHRSGFAVRQTPAPDLLQHHRVWTFRPENGHAGLRHSRASRSRRDELHG